VKGVLTTRCVAAGRSRGQRWSPATTNAQHGLHYRWPGLPAAHLCEYAAPDVPVGRQEAPKKKKAVKKKAAAPADDDNGDIGEDDLVASAAALDLGPDPNPGAGRGGARLGPPPGTAFGSVGLGVARFGSAGLGALARGAAPALGHTMTRAAGAAGAVLERFAERAPRRRSLMRPQYFD
jgi:hypothetical protein